jgi:predicted permease
VGTRVLLQMTRTTDTQVYIDLQVLAFTAVVSLATGVLFGLAPALRSLDVELNSTLRTKNGGMDGSRTHAARWNWGKVLVAGQVALSLSVLFAAGLLVHSIQKLQDVDLGYDQDNLALVRTDPLSAGYKTIEQRVSYANQIVARLASLPGVQGVTYAKNGLFSGSDSSDLIKVENFVPTREGDLDAPTDRVGPNYFSLLRIPMISGREIDARDVAGAHRVAVVNQSMARFYFGSSDPIGRKIIIDDPDVKNTTIDVVGVVADVRDHALRGPVPRRFYVPLAQSEDPTGELHFIIKTTGNPDTVLAMARENVVAFNTSVPILTAQTLTYAISDSINSDLLVAKLSGFFGIIALMLASVGLYGIMSYIVTGKTRAIGVRVALGAQRHNVLWMVLQEALTMVAFGVLVGIPVALMAGSVFSSMLYGLTSRDPVAMLTVIFLLGTVAVVASYIPARRATKVDPVIALREE